MPGAILDTSVFIAGEQGRPLGRPLPDEVSISVVTLAEVELGVLVASDADTRARWLATLTRVREQTAGLPADDRVASAYARLAAAELASGSKPRVARHLDRGDRARIWRAGLDARRGLHKHRGGRARARLTALP